MGVSKRQDEHDQIMAAALAQRGKRERLRREPPLVRLWEPTNTGLELRGRVAGEYSGDAEVIVNDTGAATIVFPEDHHLAQWCLQWWRRDKENVVLTIDKDGSRWGGTMDDCTTEQNEDGERTVTVSFLHDYEQFKHLACWPNPFTPSGLQVPKVWQLIGPAAYILKVTLFANLFRQFGSLWQLPEDPLDPRTWVRGFDYRDWPVLVKPKSVLLDDSPIRYLHSKMTYWHDLAVPILSEARLMVECRRWLVGDPQPWPGAGLYRNGQLIVDIVDKSGWWEETATGGTVAHGLARTALEAADNVIDEVRFLSDAPPDRAEYRRGWLGTKPRAPWVVYRTNAPYNTAVSTTYSYKPATVAQVTVGGKSMPGINEFMSATNKLIFNILGSFILQPGLGSVVDTALNPLYSDTILAYMSFRSPLRTRRLGWGHYMENFQTGGDSAYTLSSLLALRKGFWDTKEKVSHEFKIADGAPYLIGDQGRGHFFLGDRIGVEIPGAREGRIDVSQCISLRLSWAADKPHEWEATIGSWPEIDPVEWAINQIKELAAGQKENGLL
ncbi:hypothetical protein [Corynebacterium lactis]|uniref:Tail protein n=1 Tax=Corynebacterium lactis RW2-5 TaxID=1408189 RepID=A0A0K2H0J4_9CORY|nr:hypothetical protein [Corynebacterium lactis]ALA67560.1 tail protein [Corynebacterium lactis RW2-5]